MGAIYGWGGSAKCTSGIVYPYIMISNDSLFGFVYFVSLFLHWKGYYIKWNIKSIDMELTPSEKKEN